MYGEANARRNGLEPPLAKRQRAAIFVWFLSAAAFGLVLLPLLDGAALGLLAVIFWLCWFCVGAFALACMYIDPGDPGIYGHCDYGGPRLECGVCLATVRPNSRHCWECNKCVSNFDHHCPWLNNCIGARNYKHFLATVSSLLVMLTALLVAVLVVALDAFVNGIDIYEESGFLGKWPTIVCLALVAALYGPFWCLDAFLVSFHCFLYWRGQTTYEYLTGKTARPAPKQEELPVDEGMSDEPVGWRRNGTSSGEMKGKEAPIVTRPDNSEEREDGQRGAPLPGPGSSDTAERAEPGSEQEVPPVVRTTSSHSNRTSKSVTSLSRVDIPRMISHELFGPQTASAPDESSQDLHDLQGLAVAAAAANAASGRNSHGALSGGETALEGNATGNAASDVPTSGPAQT